MKIDMKKINNFIFYKIILNWYIWLLVLYIKYMFIDKEITNKNLLLFITFCFFALTDQIAKGFKGLIKRILNED